MIRDTFSGSVIARRKAATTLIIRHAMEGFNPLILGLLWLLSACATAQPGVVHEIDLEQLTMQATTLDEAEAWLGPPLRREGMETGAVVIDYALNDVWNRGGTVFLFFDPAHVLIGKAYIEDDADQERT